MAGWTTILSMKIPSTRVVALPWAKGAASCVSTCIGDATNHESGRSDIDFTFSSEPEAGQVDVGEDSRLGNSS